jgi:hypothetical protein
MTAIYTLWTRLPNDEGAWMIAAEDEWCWEGDPDRCQKSFAEARAKAEKDGQVVREIWINIDQEIVEAAFRPTETDAGSVEANH